MEYISSLYLMIAEICSGVRMLLYSISSISPTRDSGMVKASSLFSSFGGADNKYTLPIKCLNILPLLPIIFLYAKSLRLLLPFLHCQITTFSADVFTPSIIEEVETIFLIPCFSSNNFICNWLMERCNLPLCTPIPFSSNLANFQFES